MGTIKDGYSNLKKGELKKHTPLMQNKKFLIFLILLIIFYHSISVISNAYWAVAIILVWLIIYCLF